jgi:hypothetical protein
MLTARCCFAELKVSSDSHDSRCAQLRGDSTAPLPVHGGDAAGGTLARGTPVLDRGVCDLGGGAGGGRSGGGEGISDACTAPLLVHGGDEAGTAPLPVHGGDAAGGTLARGTPVLDKGVCDGVEGASGGGLGGSGGVSTETRRLGVWGTTFTRMSLIWFRGARISLKDVNLQSVYSRQSDTRTCAVYTYSER